MSSVSELEGLSHDLTTYCLPECAYDLRLAFGEVDLSEYVLSADLLKLLLFLFFLFAFLILLFIVEDAALTGSARYLTALACPLRILIFLVDFIFLLLLLIRPLMMLTVHVLHFLLVCVHFISLT